MEIETKIEKTSFSEKVPVTPELLQWARFHTQKMTLADVSAFAGLKSITVERLKDLESGKDEPTLSELLKLIDVYKRPFALFFLPNPPSDIPMVADHRMSSVVTGASSEKLDLAYWRAQELQNIFVELSAEIGEPISSVPIAPEHEKKDPEVLAQWARKILGVEKVFAKHRISPEEALQKWIEAIEGIGIMVMQLTFEPKKAARAFSFGTKKPPIIVLSYTDKDRGRLFSLFHELAHVVQRQSVVCDMAAHSSWAEERFCNKFAASFLMPKQEVEEAIKGINRYKDGDLDAIADFISARTGASVEAAFLRLVDLKFATQDGYLERKPKYEAAYEKWLAYKRGHGGPNPNPAGTAFRKHGKHLSRVVYQTFMNGVITRAEASSIMRLPARELPKLFKQI